MQHIKVCRLFVGLLEMHKENTAGSQHARGTSQSVLPAGCVLHRRRCTDAACQPYVSAAGGPAWQQGSALDAASSLPGVCEYVSPARPPPCTTTIAHPSPDRQSLAMTRARAPCLQTHYFTSHPKLNYYAIIPGGGEPWWDHPHDRDRFGKA
jgi:hypothetical protein